jgi:hypothetical protein
VEQLAGGCVRKVRPHEQSRNHPALLEGNVCYKRKTAHTKYEATQNHYTFISSNHIYLLDLFAFIFLVSNIHLNTTTTQLIKCMAQKLQM